jgi:hypothetical protein
MECTHLRGTFAVKTHAAGQHIMEQCPLCGVNVRGSGVWVKRQELVDMGIDPDVLPECQQPKEAPTLFDGTP